MTTPQALALADELDGWACCTLGPKMSQAAALLRTQHAEIDRKDALLRQALEILSCHIEYDWHGKPLDEKDAEADKLTDAITKELSQ